MHSVEIEYGSRAMLLEALLDTFAEGGVFVEGNYEITSGSPVTLRIAASGLDAGVFLEGLVQWRRVSPGDRSNAVTPGLGVRMLASQRERYQFLEQWASGRRNPSGRVDWRVPWEQKVFLTMPGRGTARILHAVVRDVSARGVSVSVPTRLAPGEILTLEAPTDGSIHPVATRVAWSTDDRAGLSVALDRVEDRASWERVFANAEAQFKRRRAPTRRPSTRPPKRFG